MFGDVALGGCKANGGARVIHEFGDRLPDIEHAPVLGDPLGLKRGDRFPLDQPADEVLVFGQFARRREALDVGAERFGLAIAIHQSGTVVPSGDPALEVLNGDRIVGVAHHRCHAPEVCLLLLAFGDVTLGGGKANGGARVIHEFGERHPDIEHPPVLGDPLGLERGDRFARDQPADEVLLLGQFARCREALDVGPERLSLAIAIHQFGTVVPSGDPALEVLNGDRIVGVAHHGCQAPEVCRLLLVFGDVTDVALDHLLLIHQIDVADELHLDALPAAGFQRHVVVLDVFLLLPFQEVGLVGDDVLEGAQFPDLLANERRTRVAQQLEQERIDIHHHAGFGVQDQNAVAGRLKDPAISHGRSPQGFGRSILAGLVNSHGWHLPLGRSYQF